MMNRILKQAIFLSIAVTAISCGDKTKRQLQYMPDMYQALPHETYSENELYENGQSAQKPVAGTISRGDVPYEYPNTNEGYEAAKKEFKSPLTAYTLNSKKGEALYGIYCVVCHGKKGDGQGPLVKNEKFLGIPNYKDRDITEGSIYHVLMYGRNLMGSHSGQLTIEERWQVINHVQKLRNDLLK
jgi:mono/diheme cytochrome c family protein